MLRASACQPSVTRARKALMGHSAKPAGLTLPLKERQGVSLADWALDVADDGALGVVHELHADLGHVASAASAAEHPASEETAARSKGASTMELRR